MTEYKCKHGFKIDIPENKCDNEECVSLSNNPIRAFCAFCKLKEKALIFFDEGPKLESFCEFLRADLSWDDWGDDE